MARLHAVDRARSLWTTSARTAPKGAEGHHDEALGSSLDCMPHASRYERMEAALPVAKLGAIRERLIASSRAPSTIEQHQQHPRELSGMDSRTTDGALGHAKDLCDLFDEYARVRVLVCCHWAKCCLRATIARLRHAVELGHPSARPRFIASAPFGAVRALSRPQ